MYEVEHAREIMQWYRDFIQDAPEELNVFFGFKSIVSAEPFPEELWGRQVCALIPCYSGPVEDGPKAIAPMVTELPEPLFEVIDTIPLPVLQSMFDPIYIKGLQWYLKGDFVRELSDEAIEAHIEQAARSPSELCVMHLYPINAAVHRVASEGTAWSRRDATWSMVIGGVDSDPAKAESVKAWAKNYWEATHPYSCEGTYINFLMEEGDERIQATYGANHSRLGAIKAKYDSQNFFRVNQNIKPE